MTTTQDAKSVTDEAHDARVKEVMALVRKLPIQKLDILKKELTQ